MNIITVMILEWGERDAKKYQQKYEITVSQQLRSDIGISTS